MVLSIKYWFFDHSIGDSQHRRKNDHKLNILVIIKICLVFWLLYSLVIKGTILQEGDFTKSRTKGGEDNPPYRHHSCGAECHQQVTGCRQYHAHYHTNTEINRMITREGIRLSWSVTLRKKVKMGPPVLQKDMALCLPAG